jgi:hypothetical protein
LVADQATIRQVNDQINSSIRRKTTIIFNI